ncbi:hypothetical protein [Novosphingobium sp. PhB165]|uniref:hypothetical protein n=1 Tax=Novosphingobium sp. PhB165 TaxID=2485105 RepID=UPI00140489D9|nr:hypothetical protein [Novosphingobium sp. PhB165]
MASRHFSLDRQLHIAPCDLIEVVGEPGAAVDLERGIGPGEADGDGGSVGIDGIGAEALHVSHHPICGRALAGMDGLDPTGTDMAISELDTSKNRLNSA